MSYPSSKRRFAGRRVATLVAVLLAGGAVISALPAQAVPTVSEPTYAKGTIQTMGGATINFQQGGYGPEDVLATQSQFQNPRGLNFAPNGDLFVTDALNNRVRVIDQAGNVHLVAGNGTQCLAIASPNPCNQGDGADAKSATLWEPHGVAVDSNNNVYIADSRNCVIRKVDGAGIITTFAGTGDRNPNNTANCAHSLNDPATPVAPTSVSLDQPKSLYMTTSNNTDHLWVADMGNSMLRRIDIPQSGNPTMIRVAGIRKQISFSDGDAAQTATLRHAEGIWVANDGTVYFTDGGNNLVRKISNGQISTIAGDVAAATAAAGGAADLGGNDDGDGGPAAAAHLDQPRGITGDNQGNLFIAEEHGSRIRRINMNTGAIDTIAGDGTVAEQRQNGGNAIIKGENGPALQTQFNHLHDIQINPADGSLWIADSRDNRVRALSEAGATLGAIVPTGGATPVTTTTLPAVAGKSGYWMLGNDGKVFAFGDASGSFGDASALMPAGAKAVHIEPTPSGKGYWINDDKGGVYAFGDAAKLGGVDASALQVNERATSLSASPSGGGYWVFTSKGRVFTFGDAATFGDLAGKTLNGAIQSSIPTPSGKGYFMVGSDGGVFAFGDAVFRGSMGNVKLNQPVQSLVPTRDGLGYWLVASDGGIFAFGNAPFKGSMGSTKLNKPVVGMVRYGNGYLMVGADGGIFSFSDKAFQGSLGNNPPARPIVFAATLDS